MIDYFDRTFARRCRERHKVISQMGNSSVDLHCWRVDKTLLDPNVQCSLFVVQSAMTAFKSKSGFDKSQRFFFKSIGVETVDGPRLKIIHRRCNKVRDEKRRCNKVRDEKESWKFCRPVRVRGGCSWHRIQSWNGLKQTDIQNKVRCTHTMKMIMNTNTESI